MKKLSALIALLLGLLPTASFADASEAGQKQTLTGNVALTGSLTAKNLNPVFVNTLSSVYNTSLNFGGGGSAFNFNIYTNESLLASTLDPNSTSLSFIQITGFSIQCMPFNPALAGHANYPYPFAETNGIGGGTVTVTEYKSDSVTVVGNLVLPTSPHNGPYINKASVKLNNPYTPTSGSVFNADITVADPVPTMDWGQCVVTALLQ